MISTRATAQNRRASIPNKGETRGRLDNQNLCELEWRRALAEAEIHALKKIRGELEASQNLFSAFFDHSPGAYVLLDEEGRISGANAEAARLAGRKREKLRRLPFAALLQDEEADKFAKYLARCHKAGGNGSMADFHFQPKKGAAVPVQLRIAACAGGGRKSFLVAIVDLAERRRGEEALALAREFSDNLLETVRQPMAVLDEGLKITSANGAFAEYFQRSIHAAKGQAFEATLNLWWSGNPLRTALEKVLAGGEALENFPIEAEPPGLGRRALLLSARPMLRQRSLLVAFEDVTARKQVKELRHTNEELENRVQERTEALQKSYKEMESFCYSIAHDLREPLRGMAIFSHLLADEFGPQLGPRGGDYARRIQKGAQRMDRLIQDLLNYGRLNTMPISLVDVDLEAVYGEVLAQFQAQINVIRARVEKKNPLPRVHGHPVMLRVALSNLLSNALKFVDHGVRPRVTVACENKGAQIRLWIKDNGIGIAPDYQKTIFGVFQRLHVAEGYSGTGIGLALVRQCVERIGGSVGVESAPGRGSRFWLDVKKSSPAAR